MAASRKAKQEVTEEVGGRLSIAIRMGKWSRAALAEKAGINPSAIGRLEKGGRLPEVPALKAIAAALGVTGGWLVFGDGPAPTIPLAPPECRDQRRADTGTDD